MMNSKLKMTTAQLINCHCDSLSQASISKLIGLLASITHKEWIGQDLGDYQQGNNSELWLINTFVNHQSKREAITEALFKRWQPRTDK